MLRIISVGSHESDPKPYLVLTVLAKTSQKKKQKICWLVIFDKKEKRMKQKGVIEALKRNGASFDLKSY